MSKGHRHGAKHAEHTAEHKQSVEDQPVDQAAAATEEATEAATEEATEAAEEREEALDPSDPASEATGDTTGDFPTEADVESVAKKRGVRSAYPADATLHMTPAARALAEREGIQRMRRPDSIGYAALEYIHMNDGCTFKDYNDKGDGNSSLLNWDIEKGRVIVKSKDGDVLASRGFRAIAPSRRATPEEKIAAARAKLEEREAKLRAKGQAQAGDTDAAVAARNERLEAARVIRMEKLERRRAAVAAATKLREEARARHLAETVAATGQGHELLPGGSAELHKKPAA